MGYKIIPGILQHSEEDYVKDLRVGEKFADYIQIDVVDGVFAKPVTVGVGTIAKFPSKVPLEIDLMVQNPKAHLPTLLSLSYIDQLLIHIEAEIDQVIIDEVRSHGKKCGLSLNPETNLNLLDQYQNFNQILLMTVHPGKQGQDFDSSVLDKVEQARAKYPNLEIEVDGGITDQTLPLTRRAGANRFVVGSYLFSHEDPAEQYKKLLSLL